MLKSCGLAVFLILPALLLADERVAPRIVATHGMVVCVSPPAADVGVQVMKDGGNAVDAAIAVALAEAVTHPSAGNIGGGGFMLIHPPAGKGAAVVIDYRETAPAAATAELFAKGRDSHQHKIVGVPGTVRGLYLAFEKYGGKKLSWMELCAPAVKLAEEGFALEDWTAKSLNGEMGRAKNHPEFRRVFGRPDGTPWKAGDVLKQPDLAQTLRRIAGSGPDEFYAGSVADLIVAEMEKGGGLITKADLAGYRAKEREPIRGTYRGYEIVGPSPPSAGGIVLVNMLTMLEPHDLKAMGSNTPATCHLMAEVMRRAYLDRYRTLGDPDFVPTPADATDKRRVLALGRTIDLAHATPSASLAPEIPLAAESKDTTHFSVIDGDGMAVSNTYTLEESYGSMIVVRGAGFLLNNEMNDFNPAPGVTTRGGQIGTRPNQIAPGKRMMSSQTPVVVLKDGKIILVTGSPGGRTITNTVLCVVTNVIDHGMDVQAAVDAPRIHQQWMPDEVSVERLREFPALATGLKALGHKTVSHRQGDAHSIWIDPKTGVRVAGVDHRLMGKGAGY